MDKLNDSNSRKEMDSVAGTANGSRANTSTATLKVSCTDTPITAQPSIIEDLPVFSGDGLSNLSDDAEYMVIDFNADPQQLHSEKLEGDSPHNPLSKFVPKHHHKRRAVTPTPGLDEVGKPKMRMAFSSAEDNEIEGSRGPFTYLFNENGEIRVKLTLPLELPQSMILLENGSNLHNQMKQLYRKYIRNNSQFELNLSHSVRSGLTEFFESTEIHKLRKFKNYKLFNIMDECCVLLCGAECVVSGHWIDVQIAW